MLAGSVPRHWLSIQWLGRKGAHIYDLQRVISYLPSSMKGLLHSLETACIHNSKWYTAVHSTLCPGRFVNFKKKGFCKKDLTLSLDSTNTKQIFMCYCSAKENVSTPLFTSRKVAILSKCRSTLSCKKTRSLSYECDVRTVIPTFLWTAAATLHKLIQL